MNRARQPAVALVTLVLAGWAAANFAAERKQPTGYRLQEADRSWAAKTRRSLSLRDKVAQLIQVRVPGRFLNWESAEANALADEVRKERVGGVVLFAGDVYESALLLNKLQSISKIPLLVSADFERGAAFRIAGTTSFPWTMAIGATGSEDLAYQEGAVTAREARALGVHWVFAPVMDVNNNPDNPVINIRSFGEDPQLVARLGAAFIRGARQNGVLTAAKHFPGHGDTATDTHIGLAVVNSDASRLDSVEFVPFRSAIAAGVDSIMTAHLAVPQVTGEASTPATLSSKVLTGLLRGSLQFNGLIVTDAMEMGGITSRYWTGLAAVRAIQAGADMLLLPPDTKVAVDEVVRAVRRGDISESRIDRSVEKVLAAKTRLGLHQRRLIPLDRIDRVVAAPESQKLAQTIADRSIPLVKDSGPYLPLNPVKAARILSVVLSGDLDPAPGAVFQSEMRRRYPTLRTAALHSRAPDDLLASVEKSASESDVIVCTTIVRVISGSGRVALPDRYQALLRRLAAGKPVVWVAMGNPYVLTVAPEVATYLCTFSYADASQLAAARAISGEIEITGRMPVSVPGQASIGAGIQRPKLNLTLRTVAPEAVGLRPDAFEEAKQALASAVKSKAFPGAALVVGHRGSIVLDAAAGRLDYSPGAPAVTSETIYDLASVSKAVGTTSAAMMLVDSGRLLLSASVQDYLPEFQGPGKDRVRVHHLLSHSGGLPAFLPLYKEAIGYKKVMKKVYALPLDYEPGTRTRYSDLGMMLVGEIIARAAGQPLDLFLHRQLYGPLGLKSTSYRPPTAWARRIAPTENDPWRRRVVRGEVHDENAFAMGGVAGHAGLFSNARDLAVIAQLLLNRGLYDHRRYFTPEAISRFTESQGETADGRGLGWSHSSPGDWSAAIFSPRAFGHNGFTGASVWIDPEKDLFIVFLSNCIHPSRKNAVFDEARRAVFEAVVKATSQAAQSQ